MNNDLIQERIKILTPDYRDFIINSSIDEIVKIIAQEERLSEEQTELFSTGVGLFMLCFFDIDETINFIHSQAGVEKEIVRPMFGAVLGTLPEEIVAAQAAGYSALTAHEDTEPEAVVQAPAANLTQPEVVPQVRTMADDMENAQSGQTYTSTQDAILGNQQYNQPPQPPEPNPQTNVPQPPQS